jgi:RNA polymerase sigma-70 factor (ECF subfamily)
MPDTKYSALTSLELLRRAKSGESHALDVLVGRYVPFLRRLAHGRLPRWARTAADTADLVQETLMNTFRRLDTFEPRGNGAMRAYLRQALQNRISNARRAAIRRPPSEALQDDDHRDEGPTPLELVMSVNERERYLKALNGLRTEDRDAIIGRVELGYSYEQLATALGKPSAEAARLAVRRAIVRLANAMES